MQNLAGSQAAAESMTITFEHVSFQYDKQRKVLDNFNLTISGRAESGAGGD